MAEQDALDRALDLARATSPVAQRPSGLGDRHARRASRLTRRPASRRSHRSRSGHRRTRARGGARAGHDHRPALLRVRDRRRAAGDGRRRVARGGVGSAGDALRDVSSRSGRRRSGERVAARSPRAAVSLQRRLRHRLPHGELHGARRGAARVAAPSRMGRRSARASTGTADPDSGRRRSPRLGHRCAAHARLRIRADRTRRGRRARPDEAGRTGSPPKGGHHQSDDHLRAGWQREHRRLRSARRRLPTSPLATTPGSTSTARSGSGPAPAPR